MKTKKLLLIGAIGLTIAYCTSTGVFASDNILNTAQKAIVQGMAKTYYAGGNLINNLNVNKDTKISDIVNEDSEYYQKVQDKLETYDEGSLLVDSIKDGASIGEILNSSLIYASLNKENFDSYKAMITDVADQLIDIDQTTDPAMRAIKEEKAAKIIDPSYGTIKFGKNSEGNTTVSLEKNNQTILQINTANANKIIAMLNSFNSYDEFESFLQELGIK